MSCDFLHYRITYYQFIFSFSDTPRQDIYLTIDIANYLTRRVSRLLGSGKICRFFFQKGCSASNDADVASMRAACVRERSERTRDCEREREFA